MKTLFFLITAIISIAVFSQPVFEKEKATVLRMREEEKMARDIYRLLDEKWEQQVFAHISESETYHMSRMKTWVEKLELKDPVVQNQDKPGVFTDQTLQKLYNELKASGIQSKESAFRAGAKVEEVDILDLKRALTETSNPDLEATYKYLVRASENHLRAFVRNLKAIDVDYKPVLMEQEMFDNIIKTKGQGMQNGKGNGCCSQDCSD